MTNKVLPLIAIISGALFGCGGGGDSGSSSSSTSNNVTLTFVQMVDGVSTVPSGCTVFDEDDDAGTYTYARLAPDVTVTYTNKTGEIVSVEPNSKGVLTINKNAMEDETYLNVLDSTSVSLDYYYVLSVQKEVLKTSLIQITRNQGVNSSCYTGNIAPTTNTGTITITNTTGESVNNFQYLSSQMTDSTLTSDTQQSVEAIRGESVLVKGFSGTTEDTINTYALQSNLSATYTYLETLDLIYSWNDQTTSGIDELNILLGNGGYTYDWISPDVSSEASFKINTGESWYYNATGELSSGWDYRINDTLDVNESDLDVMLPSRLTISSTSPSIEENSGVYQVDTGVTSNSDHSLIVRAKYTISNSVTTDEESLEHVVIGVATDGYLTIPDLATVSGLSWSDELLPTSSDADLDPVSVFEVSDVDDSSSQALISQYEDDDSVSFVITPADEIEHQYEINSSTYVELSK